MGRRKIEIKAIKDDRNRSVTFLKRKGGLFKKAHELSVLCSVDVAVFIFGSNKKLYEYSSTDMSKMIQRYHYHGAPNEHKGPSDFNGGQDDDDEDEDGGTPPKRESMEPQMMQPHFQGQPPYAHMRQHEASASPPINGMPFQHPGHPVPRGHTPQPHMGSRPSSRQDIRRMGPQQPQQPVNGYAYMPSPAIYNPQNQANAQHGGVPQQGAQYPYPPNHHPQHPQHPQHPPQYMEDQRRSSAPPPAFPQGPQVSRISPSPPQPPQQQLPSQQHPQQHQQQHQQHQPPLPPPPPQPQQTPQPPRVSPPQPQHQQVEPPQAPSQEGAMPAPMEPKSEVPAKPPQPPLLNTDSAIKKMPQRKQHSIFTPIDEGRSILSQHLASFAPSEASEKKAVVEIKGEIKSDAKADAKPDPTSRSQSIDVGAMSRTNGKTASPPRPNAQAGPKGRSSISTISESGFPPPSRSNTGGSSRPRLRVEIPDEPSDGGGTATAASETQSPRNPSDSAVTAARRPDGPASNIPVLPPPSPSGPALLSAGATGPPNPFARPPPQQSNANANANMDTPASALPSRFMNSEFLPSPSSFDTYWNYPRGGDSNTLPSPLNFATPVAGQGPSFLREENSNAATGKRKTPDPSGPGSSEGQDGAGDAKRVRVDS